MHTLRRFTLLSLILLTFMLPGLGAAHSHAEDAELVASLETLSAGVTVQRAGTGQWVNVARESLVGVGDSVRTDATGKARITFFANGTDTEVQPASEFRIDEFSGSADQFTLSLTVVAGQTTQRIARLLDSGSSYTINSTGLELAVRGTTLAVRVEKTGRSAMIVQTGLVTTKNKGTPAVPSQTRPLTADVPAGFGVRAEAGKGLSDVVQASSFAQLDSALDGCGALVATVGDVRLNVRTGPGLNFPRVGYQDNRTLKTVIGVTATTRWYRINFKNGYAWVYAPALRLDAVCPGLRIFPDDYGPENVNLYQDIDSEYLPIGTPGPTLTPTVTPAP